MQKPPETYLVEKLQLDLESISAGLLATMAIIVEPSAQRANCVRVGRHIVQAALSELSALTHVVPSVREARRFFGPSAAKQQATAQGQVQPSPVMPL